MKHLCIICHKVVKRRPEKVCQVKLPSRRVGYHECSVIRFLSKLLVNPFSCYLGKACSISIGNIGGHYRPT
jgi:hypothetical protein